MSETTEDPRPLPEVFTAELDGALFEALLDDIEKCATVRSVRARGTTAPLDLLQARGLLVLGGAREVQIRYEHSGERWVDTLMRRTGSIRLVRMRDAEPPPPAEERPRRRLPVLAG